MSERLEMKFKYRVSRNAAAGRDAAEVGREALLHFAETGRTTSGVRIIGMHRNPRPNNPNPEWRISDTPAKLRAYFATLSFAVAGYLRDLEGTKPIVTAGQRRKAAAVLGAITKTKNKTRAAKLAAALKRSKAAKKYAKAIAKIRKAHPRFSAARAREEYRKMK